MIDKGIAYYRRIPGEPQSETPGGQAAYKYPKDSQVGNHKTTLETQSESNHINKTPKTIGIDMPNRRLFKKTSHEKTKIASMVPEGTDLEVLLINSCRIDAIKVQTIVESFIRGKDHTVMFCMTETKVDSHNFKPKGITMFSAHRNRKEKKGGISYRF